MARSPYQLQGPPINTKITPGKPIPPAHFDRTGPGRIIKYYEVDYSDTAATTKPNHEQK